MWYISAREKLTRFKCRRLRNNEEKEEEFEEGAKRKKTPKIKETENNVFKEERDAFRVTLKDFTSLAQYIQNEMDQDCLVA